MPASDIFISYSRADRAAAMHLAECLEAEGFSVWWDAALSSGQTFDEVIEAELRAAKAVVVLWSPRSVTSRWVRAEATLADRLNKLAPVMIEPCDRPIIFELTHTTDLTDWPGDRSDPVWRRFMLDLQRAVGKVEQPPAKAATARGGPAFLRNRSEALAALDTAVAPPVPRVAVTASRPVARQAPNADDQTRATRFQTAGAVLEHVGGDFHCLELEEGAKPGRRFVVSPAGLRVGRSAPADVILSEPSVSRAHCLVELADDDRLRVVDLRSTNGTFVDGEKVEGSAFLKIDSLLQVGSFRLTHKLRGRSEI